jgi:hypothetical protein
MILIVAKAAAHAIGLPPTREIVARAGKHNKQNDKLSITHGNKQINKEGITTNDKIGSEKMKNARQAIDIP